MDSNIENMNIDPNAMKGNFTNNSTEPKENANVRVGFTPEEEETLRRIVREETGSANEDLLERLKIFLGTRAEVHPLKTLEEPQEEMIEETPVKEEQGKDPIVFNPFEGTPADFSFPGTTKEEALLQAQASEPAKDQDDEIKYASLEETVEIPTIPADGEEIPEDNNESKEENTEEQAAPEVTTPETPAVPAAPAQETPAAPVESTEPVTAVPEEPVEFSEVPVAKLPSADDGIVGIDKLLSDAEKEAAPAQEAQVAPVAPVEPVVAPAPVQPEVVSQPIIEPQVVPTAAPLVDYGMTETSGPVQAPTDPIIQPTMGPVVEPTPVKVVTEEYKGMSEVQFPGAGAKFTTVSEEENAKLAAQNSPAKVLSQSMGNQ